jgi:DNA polymerase-1
MITGELSTAFGWFIHPAPDSKVRKGRLAKPGAQPNERTLRNFVAQGNGSEMLRIACILGVEAGIKICMPVHDAVLIEAPTSQLGQKIGTDEHGRDVWDCDIGRMRKFMAMASCEVLNGFELSTDVMVVRHPDRYVDKRGVKMWGKVMEMLARWE